VKKILGYILIVALFVLWRSVLVADPEYSGSVVIREVRINDLYAVQYQYYKTHPVGHVRLENVTSHRLVAEISLEMTGYTDHPERISVELPPRETKTVDLKASLTNKILDLKEKTSLDAAIIIAVVGREELQRRKQSLVIYGRRVVPDANREKLAFFINPEDEVVRLVMSQNKVNAKRHTKKAERVFTILKRLGVSDLSSSPPTEVRHPRELLRDKLGQGYDSALLYATMLEHLHVRTMLATTTTHAMVLFEVKEHLSDSEVIQQHEKKWLAVFPDFEHAFSKALEIGHTTYRQWQQRADFTIVDVHRAWEEYKPVEFKPLAQSFIELGIMYAQQGKTAKAKAEFENALRVNLNNAAALNNLGNLEAFVQDYNGAILFYEQALRDSTDSGIHLNRGVVYYLNRRPEHAKQAFHKAYQQGVSYKESLSKLGLSHESKEYKDLRELLKKIAGVAGKFDGTIFVPGPTGLPMDSVPIYWKEE